MSYCDCLISDIHYTRNSVMIVREGEGRLGRGEGSGRGREREEEEESVPEDLSTLTASTLTAL